jgi:hypothetical protein
MCSRSLVPDSEAVSPKKRSYLIGNWTCFPSVHNILRSTDLKTWGFNLQFFPEYVLRNSEEYKFVAWNCVPRSNAEQSSNDSSRHPNRSFGGEIWRAVTKTN